MDCGERGGFEERADEVLGCWCERRERGGLVGLERLFLGEPGRGGLWWWWWGVGDVAELDVAEAALDDGEGGFSVYSVCGDGGDEVWAGGRVGEDFGFDFVDYAHAVLEYHDCGVLCEAAGDGAEGGDGVVGLGRDDEVPDWVWGDEGGSVGGEGVGDLGVEAGDGGLVAVGAEEADCAAGLFEGEELGVVLEEERDRGGRGE